MQKILILTKLYKFHVLKNMCREVFVDANVIFDYLLERKHHTVNATELFGYAARCSLVLNVCTFSFAIIYHHMRRKNIPHHVALGDLDRISRKTRSLPVTDTIIKQAMKSGFRDFEDAIQYHCAMQIPECEVIITRNPKDFALSNIPVLTPQAFLLHQFKK